MPKHAANDTGANTVDAAEAADLSGTDLSAVGLSLTFVTKNVSALEQAAVIATLGEMRTEETLQVKKVGRRANEPWRRSQRNPEGIREFTE